MTELLRGAHNLAADMAYRIGAIEHEITMLDLIRAEIKPVPEKGSPDGIDNVTFAICALRTAQDALKRITSAAREATTTGA